MDFLSPLTEEIDNVDADTDIVYSCLSDRLSTLSLSEIFLQSDINSIGMSDSSDDGLFCLDIDISSI
jgi:hypothetical protein